MSPLLRDELTIVLGPVLVLFEHTVCSLTARGWRRRPLASGAASCPMIEPGKAAWAGAIAALTQLLDGLAPGRALVRVIVSNRFVRYAVIAGAAELDGPEEAMAHARHCFRQLYGDGAERWEIRFGSADSGQSRLASAIDADLLSALAALCTRRGLRLKAVRPQLMCTFNHFRRTLGTTSAWLVMYESECLCIALFEDGRWISVRTMQVGPGWRDSLATLLLREAWRSDPTGAVEQVFLWAPELEATPRADGWTIRSLLAPPAGTLQARDRSRFVLGEGR